MKNTILGATFLLLLLVCAPLRAQDVISKERLQKHVTYLASDKLEGRGVGTKGCRKAAKYIAKQFKKIGLSPNGTVEWLQPFAFRRAANPHASENPNEPLIETENVIGFLDNNAAFTIVIGAHYDHLGLGNNGNSLDGNPNGKIHNGADDNASGTAGVIELANYFVNNKKKEPYNFLFICFSGEEEGLIGSKKFCEKPTIPLANLNFMLNMDMIGRLQEERGLLVQGVGTSSLWVPMLDIVKRSDSLKIKIDSAGIGPSDYTSFYLKNVPVIGFFSGQHSDYHKPTDDTEKINFDGMVRILNLATRIIEGSCTFDKIVFQETKLQASRESKAFKVTMGVIPDYSSDVKGMRIDGVTEGKPAAKAGFKQGDIITKLGDKKIENIYDYMDALALFKKGDTVKIELVREGTPISLDVTF
ncbi:MAG: hypothetical protein RL757_610 [Bacteroidota bacterium]